MPQLDTSTWFTTILATTITLFILFQLKISKHVYYSSPETKSTNSLKHNNPWETKWTKIYSPLSLPQQ
uniref:ATP synthase complex subunit 8 n=1 Tax=Uropsilus andersoni TaxID=182668 RepID=A0A411ADN4_9EUTH|nr:ATP synthase F0 subunit 8 [Uropsilus andersoni]AFY14194.1 ATP synthase F0 subunit 8 [Uropsilus andersoni]QAX27188.1 ATP synthase F0 subunit 8 [Uropsilus andersoni]